MADTPPRRIDIGFQGGQVLPVRVTQEAHDAFPEIFVTDRYGLIVAETNKTSDYLQADESWWTKAFADGSGYTHHGAIEYDESDRFEAISLYVPVMDPETQQAIGVMKAVCDITAIKMEL